MEIFLLTTAAQPTTEVLPALGLLGHDVIVSEFDVSPLLTTKADAVLIDARFNLAGARAFTKVLATAEVSLPVLVVLKEGGLVALSADWSVDDVLLDTAGPAEVDARLRLALARRSAVVQGEPGVVKVGELTIEEATYTARLKSSVLDLTYKEFELLKFLAQHPGRVFTRSHLLQEVWGYDYFGGTRTVDVHVRRLRAKLGVEHEALIGTVRNVGYKFVKPAEPGLRARGGDPLAEGGDLAEAGDDPAMRRASAEDAANVQV
ncbi:response regulator transcription factor [Jatrophihabitans sp. DSM 44399]|jgi:DNA-binding response OmpR family regulator|uniref:Response regulator transcription factor n=2 Tax=Jatrophihabitans lederbergiae TaxID=3075547 RepID=A0ABU2JDW3_9ACTN|nr:response regulator transcription factor [Jatrophihabitans sp. DSM 44399]MDT0263160.1 response regulator transcription factor [Jatrophihabitans sp. DSM 44399]